jgi:HTH-type transcriptional regulator / antitoxin HipB
LRVRSVADVASAVRGRRTDLKLSQSALAGRTGISRKWISEFEAGKTTAEFALVMRVLEGLGLELQLDVGPGSPTAGTSPATPTANDTGPPHSPVDLDALLEEYRKK